MAGDAASSIQPPGARSSAWWVPGHGFVVGSVYHAFFLTGASGSSILAPARRCTMAKSSKKAKKPAKAAAKRKVTIKDLKAKDAGSVKGGTAFIRFGDIKGEVSDKDHKDWSIIL
jgi:hypothetical protein